MCQLFIGADPDLYRSRSRSLRLHGVATSIRLENLFWNILEEIGARDDMSGGRLLTRLYDELAAAGLSVELPRLPGHGTTWQDMTGTRWEVYGPHDDDVAHQWTEVSWLLTDAEA